MNEAPLLFTIREIIEGGDFVAGVMCNGRALMVKIDEGEWHCSGVEPGGLSELGDNPFEAYHFFRAAFTDALRVLAGDSSNYSAFERHLLRFFEHKDVAEELRWLRARDGLRDLLRAGGEPDGPFRELPKETAEEPRGIRVVRLDYQKPEQREDVRQIAVSSDKVGLPRTRVA